MKTKLCEIDPIPTKLIKEILHSLIKSTTKIVNTSLQHGIFSKNWKMAVIRPLLKKKWPQINNIKLQASQQCDLPIQSSQKAALNQLVAQFDNNNLMSDYQSACRANQSCETVVLKLVNDTL